MFFGAISFTIGFLGLLSFVGFRFFESARDIRMFSDTRDMLDTFTTRVYRLFVFGEIPHAYRAQLVHNIRNGAHAVVVFLVSLLRRIERPLLKAGNRMRSVRPKTSTQRDPSPYLKTITPPNKDSHSEIPNDSV